MTKHFNLGNVLGRVAGLKLEKSENDLPYLNIQIECPHNEYGNIKTYGRLWGQIKIDSFLVYHKQYPGSVYKFQGFFNQYDKKGQRYSNFTFYNWLPVITQEFRATFVLVAEAMGKEDVDGEGKLYLHQVREGKGEFNNIEEDFEIYTFKFTDLDEIYKGDTVQAKGLLRAKETEDYFGISSGTIKPYIVKIKTLSEGEPPF